MGPSPGKRAFRSGNKHPVLVSTGGPYHMVNIGDNTGGQGQSAEHLSFFPVTTGKCSDHSKAPGRRQGSPVQVSMS